MSSDSSYVSRNCMYNILMPALLVVISQLDSASASPVTSRHLGQLEKREGGSSSSVKIWVPIVAVILIVLLVLTCVWSRKTGRGAGILANFSHAAAVGAGAMGPTTELTADQLTGNRSTTNTNATTTTTTATARRARRTRRTPSQISTVSLPMYMKEPGEQELVIFRGPQDMEDAPLDAEMPPVREDGENDRYSPEERYSPIPESPHDMPLLEGDESVDLADQSAAALLPEIHQGPRTRTIETGRTSRQSRDTGDTSSLVRVDTNITDETPDPRGAAPAYFEVVDLTDGVETPPAPTSSSSPPPTSSPMTASATASNRSSNRRSFRNLFGFTGQRSSPLAPPGLPVASEEPRERDDSAGALSLTSTRSRPSISHHPSHRPSQSSSSLFSITNPLNRKKSTATLNSNHLTSPSSISLASISHPLTHTTSRAEFQFPITGPTPEQLKLISSREAFSRFGMPYGEDAIAFAASTQDLNPPPEFEQTESTTVASGSRLRSQSRLAEPVELSSESSGESSGSNRSSALETPEIRVQESSRPGSVLLQPDTPATTVESSSPVQDTLDEIKVTGKPTMDAVESSPVVDELESPNKEFVVPTKAQSSETSDKVDAFTSLVENSTPSAPASASVPSLSKPPPTSFRHPPTYETRPPAAPSLRSESRASSFRSFATAQESVNEFGVKDNAGSGSETPTMSDSEYYSEQETEMGDEESRPVTPTTSTTPASLNGQHSSHHALEASDTTVRAAA